MNKFLSSLALASACSLSTVYAAHERSYITGRNDDVQWLSGELLGPGVAVEPYGTLVGTTKRAQIGWFSNFVSEVALQFPNGVVLSTGQIEQGASVTNWSNCTSWGEDESMNTNTQEDRDLDLARGTGVEVDELNDVAGFVLYVVPSNKTINIPFMMASEEFFYPYDYEEPSYNVPCDAETYADHSDKFAFFLKKGKIEVSSRDEARNMGFTAADDIARLPDGGAVEISSVNQYTNQMYFVANVVTNGPNDHGEDELGLVFPTGDVPMPMEYNGAIIGPTAVCTNVEPGEVYTIKVVISDYGDRLLNSAIFLKDHGITSGADLKLVVTGPTLINEPGDVVFTNTVSNVGPATADGVVVTNYLPVGASYLVCDTAGVGTVVDSGQGYLVWTLGDGFRSGSNAVMKVTCGLPATGFYTNSAVVATSTGDYDEKNNADEWTTQVGGEIQNITVSAISTNKAYGAEILIPDLQFVLAIAGTNGTEAISGITVAFTNQQGEAACPTNVAASAGTYGIVLSNLTGGGILPSANITYVDGILTVTQRVLTIIADDTNKVYGTTVEFAGTEFTTDPAELLNGDAVTNVTLTSDGADMTAWCGEYAIVPANALGIGLGNYAITYSNGTLKVNKRTIEITPSNGYKTYGDTYPFFGDDAEFWISDGELVNGDSVTRVELKSDGSGSKAAWKEWYDITATNATGSAGLDVNYEITYAKGKLGMDKFKFTVTAADLIRYYGQPLVFDGTEFSVNKTLPNGEKVETVTIMGVAATNIAATVGAYSDDIVPNHAVTGSGGFNTNNYVITFLPGDLTVTNAPLTIIANDTDKVYGAEFSFAGDEFTTDPAALYNGDAITNLTLTSDGTNRLATCREYEIVVTNALGIGLENYDITYLNGTLTVTNAHLTIIANSTNKVYGAELSFEGSEFTIESPGLLNDDTVTSVTLTSAGTPATAPCGEYPIEPSDALGEGLGNYSITYSNGTLTVTQALLTVTANSTNRVYGTPFEFTGTEFTIGYPGLRNGDTITNVTLTCAATNATTGCGEHTIAATNALGKGVENYRITYETGTFDVDPFKIWITADDTNKVYGSAVEFAGTEFTLNTADGSPLPNGEKVETVTITSVPATNLAAAVDEYVKAIVPSHEVTGSANFKTNNYEIVFSNGTLTVTQAPLTVTVNDTTYHIKKPWPPRYSFADFSDQLKADDTIADVTGGTGLATDILYTNAYWNVDTPEEGNESVYTNEIWATLESFDGPGATNYLITVDAGDLTVDTALPDLKIAMMNYLDKGKGLVELRMTIRNDGDGEVDPDSNYWVELVPGGPVTSSLGNYYPRSYCLDSPTGTMPDGYDYLDLTKKVKSALKSTGNHDEVFDPGDEVTVGGILYFHYSRQPLDKFADLDKFFVFGQLFNKADTDEDFRISEAEKDAAAPILGESSAAYTEVTYLYGLQYYHWNMEAGTWKGPSK